MIASRFSQTERFKPEHLLIADFNSQGHFANAILWQYLVVTAWHVARANPIILTPDNLENGNFSFRQVGRRDLALSLNSVPTVQGFSEFHNPETGETILICGHHGKSRNYFEVQAKVLQVTSNNRILVEVIPKANRKRKKRVGEKFYPDDFDTFFQMGMSGSPGLTSDDKIVGLLVAPAPGDFEGHRAYLEPATALVR